MPNTHCLPTGSLAAAEIPVPNVLSTSVRTYLPVGSKRGVVVLMHGLSVATEPTPPAVLTANTTPTGFQDYSYQLVNSLTADGWVVVAVPYPEDSYSGVNGAAGIAVSIAADAGYGLLYLNHTTLLWWDHVVQYLKATYGATIPIVACGISWGGWHAIEVAINRPTTIVGYMAHVPACILQNANPSIAFTTAFQQENCTGVEIASSALNACTLPGIVGYGTADEAVGWAASTFSGTNGTNVNTFTGSQSLSVASSANFVVGASVKVITSTGYAIITFTGTGTGILTGCTTVYGSGTIASGAAVIQNNTDALITAQQVAQSSHQVTRYTSASTHELSSADATEYSSWVASTLDPLCPASF
jgi:pimeloyl-ACP methyl ester carboxylesterase